MRLLNIAIIALTLINFFILLPKPAYAAVDMLQYFKGNGTGNNISSGEYFRTETTGSNSFTINKSHDPGYYEQFKYDNNYIYHVKDTTWATAEGNVTCSNGDEADLSYGGGAATWVPRSMEVGQSFTSSVTVQGVSSTTGKACQTSLNGSGERTVTLSYQGCITFPTGTTSANAIELDITAGPGAGEQMFYDADRGWIGFNRGEDGTGAYATDQMDQPTSGCKTVTVKVGSKLCPAGYTCVNTVPNPVSGEVVHFSKSVTRKDVNQVLKGKTGPETNFKLPQLDEEKLFFSSQEFFQRVLPDHVLNDFNTNIDDPNNKNLSVENSFAGKVGHPGCGDLYIDGQNQGKNEREPKTTDFNTRTSYNKLLVLNRFWQSIFVPGKGTTLKIKAPTPQDGLYPQPPANTGDCLEETNSSVDNSLVNSTGPQELTALGGAFAAIQNIIGSLPCTILQVATGGTSEQCKSVPVKLDFQQTKYIPGEMAFDQTSVGDSGFLNYFRPASIPFSVDNSQRDESEKTDYKVLNEQSQNVGNPAGSGVSEEGQASFQAGTCDMINAMYPAGIQPCIGTLANFNPGVNTILPGTGGLDFTIPYRDTSIRVPDTRKQKLITQTLAGFPSSRIQSEWDNVVNTAIANGINPAFMISIWVEESGAGGAGQSDFGCFDAGNTDLTMSFNDSMRCFVNFTAKEHPNDFTDWVRYFCGPKADPICSNNPNFLRRIKDIYQTVTSP